MRLLIGYEVGERLAVEVGQILELDDIDSALARLALRDERLMALQGCSHRSLRHPSFEPSLLEPRQKALVLTSVVPFFQRLSSRAVRGFEPLLYSG